MSIADDISRMVKAPPPDNQLEAARNPKAIRSQEGLERIYDELPSASTVTVRSTDGVFTFTVRVLA